MTATLRLICHAATMATRRALVPGDEPIEEAGRRQAAALGATLGRVDAAWTSPALRARQTAEALGVRADPDPLLRDLDLGSWAGRTVAELQAEAPEALMAWTTDPAAAPHGGETVRELLDRTDAWMRIMAERNGRMVAVTHATVVRAAILVVLQAAPSSFWRIDVAPLCGAVFCASGGRWKLVVPAAG